MQVLEAKSVVTILLAGMSLPSGPLRQVFHTIVSMTFALLLATMRPLYQLLRQPLAPPVYLAMLLSTQIPLPQSPRPLSAVLLPSSIPSAVTHLSSSRTYRPMPHSLALKTAKSAISFVTLLFTAMKFKLIP
jgi:hypothetical protein